MIGLQLAVRWRPDRSGLGLRPWSSTKWAVQHLTVHDLVLQNLGEATACHHGDIMLLYNGIWRVHYDRELGRSRWMPFDHRGEIEIKKKEILGIWFRWLPERNPRPCKNMGVRTGVL